MEDIVNSTILFLRVLNFEQNNGVKLKYGDTTEASKDNVVVLRETAGYRPDEYGLTEERGLQILIKHSKIKQATAIANEIQRVLLEENIQDYLTTKIFGYQKVSQLYVGRDEHTNQAIISMNYIVFTNLK